MIKLDIPMPATCVECPCISGYGKICMASRRKFSKREALAIWGHISDGYRPKWCPIVEVEE